MDETSTTLDSAVTPWLEMASQGATIVTSNQRAARYLFQQTTASARARGLTGWPTLHILTWEAWLSELWKQEIMADASAPVLITSAQEGELWRNAISSFNSATQWNEVALAALAQQAWKLLQQYAGGLPSLSLYPLYRPDWLQFQKWATAFSVETRRGGWLPPSQLAHELTVRLPLSQWQPPAQVILWGFDNFTPAQNRLLDAVRKVSEIQIVQPSTQAITEGHTFACASRLDELNAAAAWARRRLEIDPQAKLAILTTNVGEDRGLIDRTLSSDPRFGDFNFSLGFPLSHASLVRTALALLRWTWQPLLPQQVSALLLSFSLHPSCDSPLQLAEFDCDVFLNRNATDPSLTLEQFVHWLRSEVTRGRGRDAAGLLARCQNALQAKPGRENESADTWANHFRSILSAFAFPSALANSSASFQTLERWERLLDEFAGLSFNGTNFSAHDALERLQQMADQTVFQPESTPANIEILGPLEAAGSLFDGIFFISCTEDRWPIPVSPNPLLSLDLQQAHGMPGAIRGANVAAAKKMTERLLRSAPEVNFSFPAHGPDGEVRPSAVLDSLHTEPSLSGQHDVSSRKMHPAPQLIAVDDLNPAPWQFDRGHLGVSALRSQAACPFQAFATQRLRTCDLKEPEDGLDALQRGNLLHDLLHHVWLGTPRLPGLKTSDKLREHNDAETLEAFVDEHARALIQLQQYSAWEREFLLAERERVVALVCRWLTEVELRRAPFEVMEGEAKREIAIEGLVQLRVRLDRLDKLVPESPTLRPDEYVLIDYKTGKVELKGWQTPRLDEPQLPIYADYGIPSQPVGVAFASVRTGKEMGFRGLVARTGVLPRVEPGRSPFESISFADVLLGWREDIVTLAREFAAGEARVSPKHGAETCRYCGLQSLCRVAETGELLRDEPEAESND